MALAIVATPREEEPQISVPMIDVMAQLPGAGPAEVEQTILRPIERRMREIAGVEHVYGVAGDGWAMATVRFAVGEPQDLSVRQGARQADGRDGRDAARRVAAAGDAPLDR